MAADMTTDEIQAVDAFLRAELLPYLAIPDFRITPTTGIQDGLVLRPERLADGTIDLLIDVAAHHKQEAANPDLQGILMLWSARHGLATAHLRARGVNDPEGSEAAILQFADWVLPASSMTIFETPATAAQVAILELAHEIGPVTVRPTSKALDGIEHELRHNVLPHLALPGFRIVTCADDAIDGQSAVTYDARDGVVVLLDTACIERAAWQEMTQALGPDEIQSGTAGTRQRAMYQEDAYRVALLDALATAHLMARGARGPRIDLPAVHDFRTTYQAHRYADVPALEINNARITGYPRDRALRV